MGLLLLLLMPVFAGPALLPRESTAVLLTIPRQVDWLPTSWPVLSLLVPDLGLACLSWAVAMAWAVALSAVAVEGMHKLLRRGVVVSGVLDSSRSAKRARMPAFLTAMQRRELLLVGRDRQFFLQIFVAPLLAMSIQLWLNPRILSGLFSTPGNVGAVAFGLASYCVLPAIFQTMLREGPAIWLLYTFPQSLPRLLLQKALPWTMLAQLYALGVLLLGVRSLGLSPSLLWTGLLVAVGICLYSVTALCLGVQGTDPLQEILSRRVRLTYVYLELILSVAYAAAIHTSIWWLQVQMVFFCGLFALAMWQKLVDRLPYYLDPAPRSGTPISLSDGLVAAQSFFMLQVVFAMLAARWLSLAPMAAIVFSFFAAGAITWAVSLFLFWRNACPNIPKILPARLVGPTVEGVLAGLLGAACAYAYCQAVQLEQNVVPGGLALAAVLGAPLFEEFIFRGLIFAGLARQMPRLHAVLISALIFALLHPPEAVVPVFVMGVALALLFWRHGVLWPAMVAHAVYNLTVLGFR